MNTKNLLTIKEVAKAFGLSDFYRKNSKALEHVPKEIALDVLKNAKIHFDGIESDLKNNY